ncbi:VOC family protein [Kribbella deserti]|uniref:VOC family protein n=1 Tax=Kribbella deserti TaxID=1926257 RepID=A0ABV6QK27_9ACTN
MSDVGDLHLATVVVNTTDLDRATAFWTAALGYEAKDTFFDGHFARLVDPDGAKPAVLLQQAKEIPSEPAPVHIDLYTSERDRQVERLLELGASKPADWPYPDNHDFIVLLDPDGNEFCVIQHNA